MDRRGFLTLVGATALSGCQTVRSLSTETIEPRTVTRASAATDSDVDLDLSASTLDERISTDEQARIELSVEWHGTETVSFGELPARRYDIGEPSALWLLRPDRDTERKNDQTWVPAKGSRSFSSVENYTEYLPNSSVSQQYAIWANPYNTNKITPGVYRAQETAGTRSGWSTTWEFEIDIERADT